MIRFFVLALLVLSGFSIAAGDWTFQNFSGVCQAGRAEGELWDNALGWNRFDFNWSKLEPQPGKWDEAEFNRLCERVLVLRRKGVDVLPVLCYCPAWAVTSGTVEFVHDKRKKIFVPLGDNAYQETIYKTNAKGEWEKEKVKEKVLNPRLPIRADQIPQWENFVRRVVQRLSAPPYGIKYFQVWNEASPKSGFWEGKLDDYVRDIHLPAAKVIRASGGHVVYGGWPDCESISGLIALFDRHSLWRSIDVADCHYFALKDMLRLRQAAKERGFPNLAIWQTEIGFHSKYYYVPAFYPAALHWALGEFPAQPDAVKVFFFAYGSPANPEAYGYGKCLRIGDKLSPHGQALKTLGDLFRHDPIRIFTGFECRPLPSGIRPLGFSAGKRLIIAFDFKEGLDGFLKKHPDGMIEVSFSGLTPDAVAVAEKVDAFGDRGGLAVAAGSAGKGTAVKILLAGKTPSGSRGQIPLLAGVPYREMFYVVLQLK